jgi:hypothetical protein
MPRFSKPMESRLSALEEEYGVAPQQEQEEGGFFGSRGFVGNIQDYYKTDSWGDWWRNLLKQTERKTLGSREDTLPYTLRPGWGKQNILAIMELMEGPEKFQKIKEEMEAREKQK